MVVYPTGLTTVPRGKLRLPLRKVQRLKVAVFKVILSKANPEGVWRQRCEGIESLLEGSDRKFAGSGGTGHGARI